VRKELEARGLHPEIGAMSTQVAVEAEEVFAAPYEDVVSLRIPVRACERRLRSAYLWLEDSCLTEAGDDFLQTIFRSTERGPSRRYKQAVWTQTEPAAGVYPNQSKGGDGLPRSIGNSDLVFGIRWASILRFGGLAGVANHVA